MTKNSWEPILPQELAEDAWEAVLAVANALRCQHETSRPTQQLCESALLYGYLYKAEPLGIWRDLALDHLNAAIEQVSSSKSRTLALHGGLSGVGWTVEHLSRILSDDVGDDCSREFGEDIEDPIEAIDNEILCFLRNQGDRLGVYDLISGLVGFGVYFIERLSRQSAIEGLTVILDLLERWSEVAADGRTWQTSPRYVPEQQRKLFPAGYYNLGVAHGVPGVHQLLGQLITAGIGRSKAQGLLEAATGWMLARQRGPDTISVFDWVFVPGQESADSRLAWCYGDLGISAVLHSTAIHVGRQDWLRASEMLLDRCTVWPDNATGVRDTGLCHGALGVAHIFNRVHQSITCSRYKEAAVKWFRRGLEMRRPDIDSAGFFSWSRDGNARCKPDSSFLTGSVGSALALLSSITGFEPAWDRLLMLSSGVKTSLDTQIAIRKQ